MQLIPVLANLGVPSYSLQFTESSNPELRRWSETKRRRHYNRIKVKKTDRCSNIRKLCLYLKNNPVFLNIPHVQKNNFILFSFCAGRFIGAIIQKTALQSYRR